MSLFKPKSNKTSSADKNSESTGSTAWARSVPGQAYKDWPKTNGEPEEPVFLKHCTSVDMADEMLINMLAAYGIPAVKLYPSNGGFGKVVLGMSGEGADIFVPASMREDAVSLMEESSND
ncbi:MAG: hypothetical protein KBI01_06820 [Oscillospiraceae bacterium]|nr:hypothetical protein [Oscillospiraceae bacterium]